MNKYIHINFFKSIDDDGLCADDFGNDIEQIFLNTNHIIHISPILEFTTPITNKSVGKYGVIKTIDGLRFCVHKRQHQQILNTIKIL